MIKFDQDLADTLAKDLVPGQLIVHWDVIYKIDKIDIDNEIGTVVMEVTPVSEGGQFRFGNKVPIHVFDHALYQIINPEDL